MQWYGEHTQKNQDGNWRRLAELCNSNNNLFINIYFLFSCFDDEYIFF